jgi:anthranilate synthase
MSKADATTFVTPCGLTVSRRVTNSSPEQFEHLIRSLDERLGLAFSSTYEVPSRYSRWDIGLVDPPFRLVGRGHRFALEALTRRGTVLLDACMSILERSAVCTITRESPTTASGLVKVDDEVELPEEWRTRRLSIFSVVREILSGFFSRLDANLGLYGAFGYDLVFQLEKLQKRIAREPEQRDLVLYIPDALYVRDHLGESTKLIEYDFAFGASSTEGVPRTAVVDRYNGSRRALPVSDHLPGEFAEIVRTAKERFACGDLFEVVPGQTFTQDMIGLPSEAFLRLRADNPSPYGLFINLGENEYLVGASPEMYVRAEGRRIETCPISGTISRGVDPIHDSHQIRDLLNSSKDEAELTMCTDVDRNDKSRVCVPGSVKVIGRRQIELYSRVIHTVDHIEGTLREGYDGLDAFLTHMWAVTVTGAPKLWAINFLEQHEKSPRYWYGGAVGWLAFDGDVNTGLTLRTIRVKDGLAHVRAGATLLYYSDPDTEEQETELKARAMLDVIAKPRVAPEKPPATALLGSAPRVLLVDHDDSFVHTLANYLANAGARVTTYRYDKAVAKVDDQVDLVVLSPGPGKPSDFHTGRLIETALAAGVALFGVCLGLQAIVEYFGGRLGQLPTPFHGVSSPITHDGGRLFSGVPQGISVGRYHSLYALKEHMPGCLRVTAKSTDDVIMGIEHEDAAVWAVQFHPESILSAQNGWGQRLITNLLALAQNSHRSTNA